MCIHWKAGGIDITAICEAADWELHRAVDGVIAAGFSRVEADALVAFVFDERETGYKRATKLPFKPLSLEALGLRPTNDLREDA